MVFDCTVLLSDFISYGLTAFTALMLIKCYVCSGMYYIHGIVISYRILVCYFLYYTHFSMMWTCLEEVVLAHYIATVGIQCFRGWTIRKPVTVRDAVV